MPPTLTITFEDDFDSQQGKFSRTSVDPNGDADVDYSSAAIEVAVRQGWQAWFDLMPGAQFSPNANIEIRIIYEPIPETSVAWIGFSSVQDDRYPAAVPGVFHELLTGVDPNGEAYDATIGVGPDLGTRYGGISSVMAHEFGHAFGVWHGYGETTVFDNLVSDGFFLGQNAVLSHGGPVPTREGGHIASPAASIMGGNSLGVAPLDIEILRDLGLYVSDTNVFTATPGPNVFDGGTGFDTVSVGISSRNATISLAASGAVTVFDRNGAGGTDTLTNIELIEFNDIDIEMSNFSGLTQLNNSQFLDLAKVYVAYFNRAADAEGLFYWADKLAEGMDLLTIANYFSQSIEAQLLYPNTADTSAFVAAVYENVLGRTPDPAGFEFWTNALGGGAVQPATFVLSIIQGAIGADTSYLENKANLGVYFAAIKGMSDTADAHDVLNIFGNQASSDIASAKTRVDEHYSDAVTSGGGDFLFKLIGVVDDPFTNFA